MAEGQQAYPLVKPFLKWAGGKRSLLNEILPRVVADNGTYYEPFLGAGAVFLALPPELPKIASDLNEELINTWLCVRDHPDSVINALNEMENSSEFFLEIRSWDRTSGWPDAFTTIERAARTIYLNRTCFNGLYRVNSKGQFNVPFGKHKNPRISDRAGILQVSQFLSASDRNGELPTIKAGDFLDCVAGASEGDFVYFDPPYIPHSKSASFVSYASSGFGPEHQLALRNIAVELTSKGVEILISNSNTAETRFLYSDPDIFNIDSVRVPRAIGASATSRVQVEEVLISNSPGINK